MYISTVTLITHFLGGILSSFFLIKLFYLEVIGDPHALVKNNTEESCVPLT